MIQTCNDAYWEYMPSVRDRTEGAPCGQTFEDVTQSTLCPHEELAPAGPIFTSAPTTCYAWTTAWPHAVPNVQAMPPTTDDKAKVTCSSCLHALGSQKHEPPTTARKAAALMGVLAEPDPPTAHYATVTRDPGEPDLAVGVFSPLGRGLGLFVIKDVEGVSTGIEMALKHSGVDLLGDDWKVNIDYEGEFAEDEKALRSMEFEVLGAAGEPTTWDRPDDRVYLPGEDRPVRPESNLLVIEAQELELDDVDKDVLTACFCAHCEEGDGICPQAVVKLMSDYAVSLLERVTR